MTETESRFATREEIFSPAFAAINEELFKTNQRLGLSDHTEINNMRFPWSAGKFPSPAVYVSRMWEYPFALLNAGLQPGMKCADIGCGTSPFTFCLAARVGPGCVTGFDPDVIDGPGEHSMFGANKKLLNQEGIAVEGCDMSSLRSPDEAFDRVFCLSVMEHVEEPSVWQRGLREMYRILKPGGLLILTMDLGISTPLTNIFDVIRHSGLSPAGCLRHAWPKERFVLIDGMAMDVYGLVLVKSNKEIFADYEGRKPVPEYTANRSFVPSVTSGQQIQIGKDLARPYGGLRILLKSLTGRYWKKV